MEEWYQHEIFTSYLSLEEEITVVYDVIILNGAQESRSFVLTHLAPYTATTVDFCKKWGQLH